MKGKAKKVYRLTPKGAALLDALLNFLEENIGEVTKGLDALIAETIEEVESS